MPVKDNREYRNMNALEASESDSFIVEGYASTFEPYEMWEDESGKFFERVDAKAFENADISDVILQYDHSGRVYARQSNNTLELNVDEKGLHIRADLSKTSGSKELYEDIKAGLITKMSFAFTVKSDHYDKESRTRVIDEIQKIYDVSAVSIPANPDSSIGVSARSFFEGVIEEERKEFAREQKRKKIKLEIELMR